MKIIEPICRSRLTRTDAAFIASVLRQGKGEEAFLADLLGDKETRDMILDERRLLDALQDRPEFINISGRLYFYLLVRHALIQAGVDDRELTDYIAEMLDQFTLESRLTKPIPHLSVSTVCITDMLAALKIAREEERFVLHSHIGNYALFFTGLYPGRISWWQDFRGTPGIAFYEDLGRLNFEIAGRCRLAGEFNLTEMMEKLSDLFHPVRMALNDLTDRFMFIDAPSVPAPVKQPEPVGHRMLK